MRRVAGLGSVALLLVCLLAQGDERLFDEQGYRIAWLRSPTPETVEGARTLSVKQLEHLLHSEPTALLLDVLPLTWMGIWVETEPHHSLPGAVWLPNVGRAELDPLWDGYLDQNLERLTGGDKRHPLIVFCRADCWYSWNAVRRLVRRGYSDIYWYRLGTDGWLEAGHRLTDIDPEPMLERSEQSIEEK